jgi:hypothetical protein
VVLFPVRERMVVPEILDHLPAADPEAVRSRRDLRFLDVLLGNSRWILAALKTQATKDLGELGAGEGWLAQKLAETHQDVHAFDLAPRPPHLTDRVRWHQGDFFETFGGHAVETLVGALILHHFERPALERLGTVLCGCKRLIFVEPLRAYPALVLSSLLWPFLGRVTRHDMIVSIRAGFLPGELAECLGLGPDWKISETVSHPGTLRFSAWRD